MPKSTNQKQKLLYLMKILLENTDDQHYMTVQDLIIALEKYDIKAERKSIYDDIQCLSEFGIDIITEKVGVSNVYYIGNRQFELPELKLLVDSVQSSKFITTRKSNELIKKIEGLASKHEAKQLQRQVYVRERVKTVNENIYLNVDVIHAAIAANHKIKFQYFQWNLKKKPELRHGGAFYEISPWALSWDDENYYLVAYDDKEEKIKHFRVDKMLKIEEMDALREGKEHFKKFDMAEYAKRMFSMYGGEEKEVRIECSNNLVGVMIDRFGRGIIIHPVDDEHFAINVKVAVSKQFIHWIMSLGDGAKITGPDDVVEDVKKEVSRLASQYL